MIGTRISLIGIASLILTSCGTGDGADRPSTLNVDGFSSYEINSMQLAFDAPEDWQVSVEKDQDEEWMEIEFESKSSSNTDAFKDFSIVAFYRSQSDVANRAIPEFKPVKSHQHNLRDGFGVTTLEEHARGVSFNHYETSLVTFTTVISLGQYGATIFTAGELHERIPLWKVHNRMISSFTRPLEADIEFALSIGRGDIPEYLGVTQLRDESFQLNDNSQVNFQVPKSWEKSNELTYDHDLTVYRSTSTDEDDYQDFIAIGLMDYRELPEYPLGLGIAFEDDGMAVRDRRDPEPVSYAGMRGWQTNWGLYRYPRTGFGGAKYEYQKIGFRYGEKILIILAVYENENAVSFKRFLHQFLANLELPVRSSLSVDTSWRLPFQSSLEIIDDTRSVLWSNDASGRTLYAHAADTGQLLFDFYYGVKWNAESIKLDSSKSSLYFALSETPSSSTGRSSNGRLFQIDASSFTIQDEWDLSYAPCHITPLSSGNLLVGYTNGNWPYEISLFDPSSGSHLTEIQSSQECHTISHPIHPWAIATDQLVFYSYVEGEERVSAHYFPGRDSTVHNEASIFSNEGRNVVTQSGIVYDILRLNKFRVRDTPMGIGRKNIQALASSDHYGHIYTIESSPDAIDQFLGVYNSTDWTLQSASHLATNVDAILTSAEKVYLLDRKNSKTSIGIINGLPVRDE